MSSQARVEDTRRPLLLGGTGEAELAREMDSSDMMVDHRNSAATFPSGKRMKHFNLEGQAHELTFSCYRSLPLLASEQTKTWFIEAVNEARAKRGFSVFAFVIMPEHVHIITQPDDVSRDIPWFLKSMKQPVSRKASVWLKEHDPRWFDRLTHIRRDGKREFRFWQAGGGYDRNITDRNTLLRMVDYIHHNPVRRGLAETPTDWKWSSASWYETGECVLRIDPLPE
jgi:putative transposase